MSAAAGRESYCCALSDRRSSRLLGGARAALSQTTVAPAGSYALTTPDMKFAIFEVYVRPAKARAALRPGGR